MEKGDRFITNKGIILVFEKYDKLGDALFTSPDVKFDKMPGIEEGYMCFPVHVMDMYMKKIEENE
jgi:hypothetical protein